MPFANTLIAFKIFAVPFCFPIHEVAHEALAFLHVDAAMAIFSQIFNLPDVNLAPRVHDPASPARHALVPVAAYLAAPRIRNYARAME